MVCIQTGLWEEGWVLLTISRGDIDGVGEVTKREERDVGLYEKDRDAT